MFELKKKEKDDALVSILFNCFAYLVLINLSIRNLTMRNMMPLNIRKGLAVKSTFWTLIFNFMTTDVQVVVEAEVAAVVEGAVEEAPLDHVDLHVKRRREGSVMSL